MSFATDIPDKRLVSAAIYPKSSQNAWLGIQEALELSVDGKTPSTSAISFFFATRHQTPTSQTALTSDTTPKLQTNSTCRHQTT